MMKTEFKSVEFVQILSSLLLVMLLLLIAACGSVTNNDRDRIVQRSSDNLHVYKNGEYIQYTVTGTVTKNLMERDSGNKINLGANQFGLCYPIFSTTEEQVTGTLSVTWNTNNDLTQPLLAGGALTVIRQESTLTLDSIGTYTSTEYISQNTSNGALTLRAYDDNPGMLTYYWVTTDASLSTINNPVLWPSPVPDYNPDSNTANADYYVHSGCDASTSCTESIRTFTHNLTFNGENPGGLHTALGLFNPLGIAFNAALRDTSATNVNAMMDIRGFCNTQESFFAGIAWILPEVGVVELENACTSNDVTNIDLTDTAQVNIPPSTVCALPTETTGPAIEVTIYDLSAKIATTNIKLPQ